MKWDHQLEIMMKPFIFVITITRFFISEKERVNTCNRKERERERWNKSFDIYCIVTDM